MESLLCPCTSIKQVLHLYKSSSVCVLRTKHKATSYAVRKMISEKLCGPSIRPLLMLLEKLYQKTAFPTINFPTGFFQAPVLIFTAYQNKKGNKKVVFTGRLQGGVCSLYSIEESVQCIHIPCAFCGPSIRSLLMLLEE